MVFFSCGACGESMKKNQVEKHYTTKCRNCEFLSCVDCGKEFWGNDYASHNKCISEEEKTHGALYKKDPNANKGERKQEMWTQQVHAAISKVKGNPSLARLLERLKEYPNIPRKKAKFENFVKNSLRVHDGQLLSLAWDAISVELEAANGAKAVEFQEPAEKKASEENIHIEVNGKLSKKRKADYEEFQPEKKKNGLCNNSIITPNFIICNNDEADEKTPFKWKSVIIEVLNETPEHKMTIKKLRKKVIAKLKSSTNLTAEEMKEKFNKKLAKNSHVKIVDDVVSMCI